MSNRGVSGRGRFSHLLIAAGLALAAGGQASAQYSIEFLPSAVAGGDGFQAGFAVARGISGNGQVIVGSTNIYHQERAVVWRRENGSWTRSFLPMANAPDGRAAGRALTASWDGSTIVGATGDRFPDVTAGGQPRATPLAVAGVPAIWRTSGGATSLEMPISLESTTRGVATGVSADGQSVAFYARDRSSDANASRVGRMTGSTLTYLSPEGTNPGENYAISALLTSSNMSSDGSTIVGMRQVGDLYRPFRWTESSGFEEFATFPGISGGIGAVSGDGAVLSGHSFSSPIVSQAVAPFVYRDGQLLIPRYSGPNFSSVVTGLSRNGYYGVGVAGAGDAVNLLGAFTPTFPSTERATDAVVLEGNRFFNLAQLLRNNGVDLPTTTRLTYAHAITPDGLTIVGVARDDLTNQRMSFIATIPTPGAAASMGLGMLMLASRRRR
jgi:uncharacterized membrane protein